MRRNGEARSNLANDRNGIGATELFRVKPVISNTRTWCIMYYLLYTYINSVETKRVAIDIIFFSYS